jgi:hypothetical protein
MNQPGKAIGSGIAGAAILTLVHETLRQFVPQAPRMERLGMQAIEKLLNQFNQPAPPTNRSLYGQAIAGDLLTNSLYYSIAGASKKPWMTGLLAGLTAGVAAVTLPKQLGLEEENANRTPATTAMTIGLYTLGGIVAAGVASLLTETKTKEPFDSPYDYSPELNQNKINEANKNRSWKLKD